MARFGLIEGGGTKFVVGIADHENRILVTHRVPTTTPGETLSRCSDWLKSKADWLDAIGIGCFGPLDLDRNSPHWGRIRNTTKPQWSGADIVGHFSAIFDCPVGIETDVDGAALGEQIWGAGIGMASLLYLTVGTGIGGGFVSANRLLRGLSHPEMGHIRVPRHPADLDFAGICPFHGDCLEGVASGPAIAARWGSSLSELPTDHPATGIIGWYLGQAICTFQAIMEPARIVLGGGVMQTTGLIDQTRCAARDAGEGYFVGEPAAVIVPPKLGGRSGLMGALAIAQAAIGTP